jgi:RimJ/RimL family protein N-acetyltransferase
VILETDRLILRTLEASDDLDLLAYQSNPEVVRFIPWPARTHTEVKEALVKAMKQTHLDIEGDWLVLGIENKESGKVIGQLNLSIKSDKNKHGEFGYVLNPAFHGNGYVHEACTALLDWAFTEKDFHRLTTVMDARNKASRKVSEKLGMRLEGTHVEDDWFKDEWTNTYIFAVLRSEWLNRKTI